MKNEFTLKAFVKSIDKIIAIIIFILLLSIGLFSSILLDWTKIDKYLSSDGGRETSKPKATVVKTDYWTPPDTTSIARSPDKALIQYGRQLIVNTSYYLGPKGIVAHSSNGMNCQNCHLNAGTKVFGNNYSAVASTYPKFRGRSGTKESIEKRVNDCFERSLNGSALKNNSKEMKAIVMYIKWIGTGIEKGESPKGSGLLKLTFLDRPANRENGKILYEVKCSVCHGTNGQGKLKDTGNAYIYPPLWGKNSYNVGAGLYRLSMFAGYIKANMPLGATYDAPQLTDEECWDIAAFVNSEARPKADLMNDWPDISKKPFDHPFGPFADNFSETQHTVGPFQPIVSKN